MYMMLCSKTLGYSCKVDRKVLCPRTCGLLIIQYRRKYILIGTLERLFYDTMQP